MSGAVSMVPVRGRLDKTADSSQVALRVGGKPVCLYFLTNAVLSPLHGCSTALQQRHEIKVTQLVREELEFGAQQSVWLQSPRS